MSILDMEFPYIDKLPKADNQWLRRFFRADVYASAQDFLALNTPPSRVSTLLRAAAVRSRAYRRDVFFSGLENIFSVDTPKIAKEVSSTTTNFADVIDINRKVQTRHMFCGYGTATGLQSDSRVTLAIDSHKFDKRNATVISARRDEWFIKFDNGMFGYFKSNELNNII